MPQSINTWMRTASYEVIAEFQHGAVMEVFKAKREQAERGMKDSFGQSYQNLSSKFHVYDQLIKALETQTEL